jgi:hypothetical protein
MQNIFSDHGGSPASRGTGICKGLVLERYSK